MYLKCLSTVSDSLSLLTFYDTRNTYVWINGLGSQIFSVNRCIGQINTVDWNVQRKLVLKILWIVSALFVNLYAKFCQIWFQSPDHDLQNFCKRIYCCLFFTKLMQTISQLQSKQINAGNWFSIAKMSSELADVCNLSWLFQHTFCSERIPRDYRFYDKCNFRCVGRKRFIIHIYCFYSWNE